jgi:hypothetical protein
VTTASMRTASTPTLKRGAAEGCCADTGDNRRIAARAANDQLPTSVTRRLRTAAS